MNKIKKLLLYLAAGISIFYIVGIYANSIYFSEEKMLNSFLSDGEKVDQYTVTAENVYDHNIEIFTFTTTDSNPGIAVAIRKLGGYKCLRWSTIPRYEPYHHMNGRRIPLGMGAVSPQFFIVNGTCKDNQQIVIDNKYNAVITDFGYRDIWYFILTEEDMPYNGYPDIKII